MRASPVMCAEGCIFASYDVLKWISSACVWSLTTWVRFPENTYFCMRELCGSSEQKHTGVIALQGGHLAETALEWAPAEVWYLPGGEAASAHCCFLE